MSIVIEKNVLEETLIKQAVKRDKSLVETASVSCRQKVREMLLNSLARGF